MNRPERSYHHGDLRQTLIDAACQHLLDSGADTLSLRALAREVGVSQTAPYRHFDSKSALFAAIATHGFQMLRVACLKVRGQFSDDVEQAIIAVGLEYLEWAKENPEKFRLFFDSSLVDMNLHPELQEAGEEAFAVLISIIEQGIREDIFVDRPILELAGAYWSSIHGAASLLICKPEEQDVPDHHSGAIVMRQLAADPRPTLELFLNSMRKPC